MLRIPIGTVWATILCAATTVSAQLPSTNPTEDPPSLDDALPESLETEQSPVDQAAGNVAVGEYVEAINIVELEIDRIERRSNRYHNDLVQPLVVLGDALAGVGDRTGALGAYDRALHITRVNQGLNHPDQVDIVYREAAILALNGKKAQANRRHEYAYDILLRSHGGNSPGLIPGIFSLADWYLVNYNIFSARGLYEHALSLADDTSSPDDPARLRALRGVAATYRSERFPPYQPESRPNASPQVGYRYGSVPAFNNFAKGERALIEVVNAVGDSETTTKEGLADAVLELADWYLVFGKQGRATALYQHVWGLLQSNPDKLAATFDSPTPLYLPLPGNPPDGGLAGRPRDGVVELSCRVNADGSVSQVATLYSDPQDLMDAKVRRAVRRARYRPVFDGEQTVSTDDVRVSHTFVYIPEDDTPTDRPSVPPTDAAVQSAREPQGSASTVDSSTGPHHALAVGFRPSHSPRRL